MVKRLFQRGSLPQKDVCSSDADPGHECEELRRNALVIGQAARPLNQPAKGRLLSRSPNGTRTWLRQRTVG
jgi:hypothetical protein